MRDIASTADIELLIDSFYENLLKIEDIKPVFAGINIESHLPHIVAFWDLVLFDKEGYKTNVFDKHRGLFIKTHMFDEWLNVFTQTVDSLFVGEKAKLAKERATVLTFTFKSKWEHLTG
jgi:hemoglobin